MATLDRNHSAVLVMDFQASILDMVGQAATATLDRAAAVVGAARAAGVPVFYVVIGFRPGYPELSARNPMYGRIVPSGRFITQLPGDDVHPALKPRPEEAVVVKHRVGAFAGTDLEVLLRARSVDTLILLGISTSGVVLSTVRHAADADYRLLVVSDACADPDGEVHRVLVEKVLPRQATVLPSAELIAALEQ
jgi:nicotinamidase-related amidase